MAGRVGNDDVSIAAGTAAFSDKNVGTGKALTFSGYTLTGANAGNYSLTQPADVTANIMPKEVKLGWTNTALTYNGQEQAPTAEATGLVNDDTVSVTVKGGQTNAGAYTATASALTGEKASNYVLPKEKTTAFTIAPADITKAVITLGDALTYNGSEQIQTVKAITLDGKDITAFCTVTGNRGTDAGPYTLTVRAGDTGNYTGTTSKEFVITKKAITPTITVSGTYTFAGSPVNPVYTVKDGERALSAADYTAVILDNAKPGTGKITVTEGEKGNYTFQPTVQTFTIGKDKAEIRAEIRSAGVTIAAPNLKDAALTALTETEREAPENGTDVTVWLDVYVMDPSEVPAGDAALLTARANTLQARTGEWISISLHKQVGDAAATEIHQTAVPVSFTIEVPQRLRNTDSRLTRTFYLLRAHEGAETDIAATAGTVLQGSTDRFSTYLLAYRDTVTGGSGNEGGGSGTSGGSATGGGAYTGGTGTNYGSNVNGSSYSYAPSNIPRTGDESRLSLWGFLAVLSGAGALLTGRKRKKEKTE